MTDPYYQRYSQISIAFTNRRIKTTEQFIDLLVIDEEVIGFQFWLSDEIFELGKKHAKEWSNLQKQIAHTFYNRNLHYFYGALYLAESGLCDPCYNNLRTIYESILKIYYLWAYPEETQDIQTDMESERPPRYNHAYMIQRLYSERTQDSMRNLFHGLSGKAHANYTGVGSTLEYSPKQVEDCLKAILLLSFYNITAEIENQSADLSILEKFQLDRVGTYLEKLRKRLVDEKGEMALFFPDKPDLWDRLDIRSDIDLKAWQSRDR